MVDEAHSRYEQLFRWILNNEIKIHIFKQYALKEAMAAHNLLESRLTTGELLLIP